ncbi:inositol 3-kinase [Cornus florida]|uniref:inositol 3-kinase n=1 Tax=Cornus florida TaxID=4283 RepID=UPI00289FD070|nr:inositol 3-kinase [Cornus florida]
MVRHQNERQTVSQRGLIVGNYCHDILTRDDVVIGQTLGGAVSFISAVLDGLSITSSYVAKVGSDFAYGVNHDPIVSSSSPTTLFHAHFSSEPAETRRQDRILKRVYSCEPISPSDLPDSRFDFGMAVGVAGEILPETLERMIDVCNVVFVDIQALIRKFDSVDGTVKLVGLKESGFFHLLPRIGFLKASAEEAPFVDVEEARKWCCVVVTNGKDGCTVYWKDGEVQIAPFPTIQVDPTGAGDSFLGGFVAGLIQGLAVPDAALLGNFFGSLTVGQIGLPEFDRMLLQRVKDEVQGKKMQCTSCHERQDHELKFLKPIGHEQFHASLSAAKLISICPIQECQQDRPSSPRATEQDIHPKCNGQQKLLLTSVHEGQLHSAETRAPHK